MTELAEARASWCTRPSGGVCFEPAVKVLPHLGSIAAYHADTPEVGSVAKRAGVATLVLTHLIPAPRNEGERQGFVDEVRSGGFEGELIIAADCTTVRF